MSILGGYPAYPKLLLVRDELVVQSSRSSSLFREGGAARRGNNALDSEGSKDKSREQH